VFNAIESWGSSKKSQDLEISWIPEFLSKIYVVFNESKEVRKLLKGEYSEEEETKTVSKTKLSSSIDYVIITNPSALNSKDSTPIHTSVVSTVSTAKSQPAVLNTQHSISQTTKIQPAALSIHPPAQESQSAQKIALSNENHSKPQQSRRRPLSPSVHDTHLPSSVTDEAIIQSSSPLLNKASAEDIHAYLQSLSSYLRS